MKADGILFDLDGTLWDSTENVAKAWNAALEKMGLVRRLTVREMMQTFGLPMTVIFERLFPEAGEEQRLMIQETLTAEENAYMAEHGGILYEGVEDTLRKLAGSFPLAIVSNCQEGYIEAFLHAHRLEKYFQDYESFGRTGLLKADNIRLVAARNHLEHPVYVGDIQGDSDSAHQAGVRMVWAAYGFGEVKDAEGVIHSFPELFDILEREGSSGALK